MLFRNCVLLKRMDFYEFSEGSLLLLAVCSFLTEEQAYFSLNFLVLFLIIAKFYYLFY